MLEPFITDHMRLRTLIPTLLILISPLVTHAAALKSGESYSLPKDEVIEENLYAAGGALVLSGEVQGDVAAAGGDVKVTGAVEQDLLVAGGSLTLLGDVGGDMRVAGGSVTIGSVVGGELIAAGGTVHVLDGTVIEGDLIMTGGMLVLEGEVRGDVMLAGGETVISGTVGGKVKATTEKLTLTSTASVAGNLEYASREEAEIDEAANIGGEILFERSDLKLPARFDPDRIGEALSAFITAFIIIKFLVILVTGLLLVWWFSKPSKAVVHAGLMDMSRNFLRGLVSLIVGPVIVGLLFATILGWVFAVLAAMAYATMMLLSSAYAGIIFGSWLRKTVKKDGKTVVDWKTATYGIALLALIGLVPLFGWIVAMVFYLIAFGSLVSMCHERIWKSR